MKKQKFLKILLSLEMPDDEYRLLVEKGLDKTFKYFTKAESIFIARYIKYYPHTFYNEFFRCTFGVPTFKRIDNYTQEMKEIIWEYHYYLHQYVGPFFYINGAIKSAKTDVIKGNINDDFINCPISHFDYFQTLGIDDDYGHYPRGRVIYNNKTNEFIIYLDKSLINKKEVIEQIMYLYRLKNQNTLVKTDEHYGHDNL